MFAKLSGMWLKSRLFKIACLLSKSFVGNICLSDSFGVLSRKLAAALSI